VTDSGSATSIRPRASAARRKASTRLARPFYAVVAALVVIGGVVAYLLVPRERELAEIYHRGREFAAARDAYEAQLAGGALPLSIVVPLADVYIYFGQIKHAIGLLQRYEAAYPGNVEILRRLADAYSQDQEISRRMETLEKIDKLKVDSESLREVLDEQRDRADSNGQMATLARLIERPDTTPFEVAEYGRLLAGRGEYRNAVVVLERRAAQGPKALNYDGIELLCSLLLDLNRPDDAQKYAASFLEGNTDPSAIGAITSLFVMRGRPDIALHLIEPFQARAGDDPKLLGDVIEVERAAGRSFQALARLQKLDDAGHLPQSMYVTYVELAVEASDRDQAFKGLERVNPHALQPATITGLIELALMGGDVTRAAVLARAAGDDVFMDAPMVAAELALAQGDMTRAEMWVRRAQAMPSLSPREAIALARYEASHDQKASARRRALAMIENPRTPDGDLPSLASLFIQLGVSASDAALFDRLRLQRPSPRADAAWALVATAAGQTAAVHDWLQQAQGLDEQTLADLFYAARDAKQAQLAFAAAERLYKASASPRNAAAYAQALTDVGRAADALPLLRPLLPGDREIAAVYLTALAKAYAAGAPVRDELVAFATKRINDPSLTATERGDVAAALVAAGAYDVALPLLANLAKTQRGNWFWAYVEAAKKAKRNDELAAFLKAELARSDLSRKEREDRIYALIDLGGAAAALPYLQTQAETYGGEWVYAYEEAAKKAGQEGQYLDFLTKRLDRTDLPRAERRDGAFRLLAANRKPQAEKVFFSLAQDQPPDSPEVQQLLYLWGPRPAPAQLDWLEKRARTARGAEKGAWLDVLANDGAAARVVQIAEDSGPVASMDAAVFASYIQALAALKRNDKLAQALDQRLSKETSPIVLRKLARAASEAGLAAPALDAYKRILSQAPDDRDALRGAGIAAASAQRYQDARLYLTRYFAQGPADDYEAAFVLGEALSSLDQQGAAANSYARALKIIDAANKPSFQMRLVRANILQRLGRSQEALKAFEALRAERPNDKDLRADMVTALMQNKSYDYAQRVLKSQ